MLAAAYFFTFAASGLNVLLATPALLQTGFAASLVGGAFSLRSFLQMLATPLWAAVADSKGDARAMAIRGQLSLVVAMAILAFATSSPLLMLGFFVFGFFGGGATTLIDGLNIITIGSDRHRFGAIRLFGTLGYAVTIVATGQLPPLSQRMVFGAAAVLCIASAFALRNVPATRREPAPLRFNTTILKDRAFVAITAAATLQWASHSAFTVFMIPLGTARGVPKSTIAMTVVAGLLIEMAAMRTSGRLYHRFGARNLLLFTALVGMVRWLGLWLTTGTLSFVLLHTLHGISFGMFYPTIVTAVASISRPEERVTAQALLTSVGFGLGGAVGSSLAGFTFDHFGAQATWAAMLVPATLTALLAAFSRGIKSLCVPR